MDIPVEPFRLTDHRASRVRSARTGSSRCHTRTLDSYGSSAATCWAPTRSRVDDEAPVVVNAGGSASFVLGTHRRTRGDLATYGELTELERATLVADNWAFLFASRIEWTSFLDIARGLQDQDEPRRGRRWRRPLISSIERSPPSSDPTFAATVRDLFTPQFERLGWDARPTTRR